MDRTPERIRKATGLRLGVLPDGTPIAAVGTAFDLLDKAPSPRPGLDVFRLRTDGSVDDTAGADFALPAAAAQRPQCPLGWAVFDEEQIVVVGIDKDRRHGSEIRTNSVPIAFNKLFLTFQQTAKLEMPYGREPMLIFLDHQDVQRWRLRGHIEQRPLRPPSDSVSLAWIDLPNGSGLLATSAIDGSIQIRDGDGNIRHELRAGTDVTHVHAESLAWTVLPDANGWKTVVLASGDTDGVIRLWDGATGTQLHEIPRADTIESLAWIVIPDGPTLLAGATDSRVRVWGIDNDALLNGSSDLPKTALLHELKVNGESSHFAKSDVGWALLPGGVAWLYAGTSFGSRIWEIPHHPAQARPTPNKPPFPPVPTPVQTGLIPLASAGVCPSLGMLADLVSLTDPARDRPLFDERLRDLASEPGIRALRDLKWPPAARIGLAALLASDLPEHYLVHPPGLGPRELSGALGLALTGETCPPRRTDASPVLSLSRAAAAVTDRTLALLTLLGPQAVADDPVLPLRNLAEIPKMPAVDLRRVRLLSRTADDAARHAGTAVLSPGTSGVTRRGTPNHLLPSQLALPQDLRALRHARHELLYRLHTAAVGWVPEPVTLVLDTSPATFGPAEVVLRSLAHLLTTTLWAHGSHPVFIGLDRPASASPLTRPADLPMLWASRSLEPPDLTAALAAAASRGLPAVVLTTHRLLEERMLVPGPGLRLATTHVLDDLPRIRSLNQYHVHLPPDAEAFQLTEAARRLLMKDASN